MSPVRLLLVLVAATLVGCAQPPRFLQPFPQRDFHSALKEARAAADAGRWATADRILADFARRYPDTDEAHDALLWRALFRLSPANDTTAQQLAIPTLEAYLEDSDGDYRTEARILLDLARSYVAVRREAAEKEREISEIRAALGRAQERQPATTSAQPSAPSAPDRGLVQEVERLKAELARANQELERIRRRLARQSP